MPKINLSSTRSFRTELTSFVPENRTQLKLTLDVNRVTQTGIRNWLISLAIPDLNTKAGIVNLIEKGRKIRGSSIFSINPTNPVASRVEGYLGNADLNGQGISIIYLGLLAEGLARAKRSIRGQ